MVIKSSGGVCVEWWWSRNGITIWFSSFQLVCNEFISLVQIIESVRKYLFHYLCFFVYRLTNCEQLLKHLRWWLFLILPVCCIDTSQNFHPMLRVLKTSCSLIIVNFFKKRIQARTELLQNCVHVWY